MWSSKKRFTFWLVLVLGVMMLVAGCGSKTPAGEEDVTTRETDVVVVGAGAAGLAAAIEAADAGAEVILLEKMPIVGGSTYLSGGIVYGAETPGQQRAGIQDSAEDLAAYWMERAEGDADEDLINFVAEKSGETIAWLEELGVEFAPPTPAGTSPVPRAHRTKEGRGVKLVEPLEKAVKDRNVELLLETPAKKLLTDESGAVTGVEAQTKDGETLRIMAKAVVLATGGFDRNKELVAEYSPKANDHITYVAAGNTGDGLIMAREVGADIVAKGGVIGFRGVAENIPYTHPVGGLIFTPSLYVDSNGQRFVNEAVDYPLFYDAMVENGDDAFYLIFDANNYAEALEEGLDLGVVFKGETLAELAEAAGIDPEGLEATVAEYNSYAEAGEDAAFGKDPALLSPITEPDFYALKVLPATLGTMGGPRINLKTQVLDTSGNPIPNLYAAGEVANGQFFKETYPASGTSIQMSFTLGRVAGQEAAKAK